MDDALARLPADIAPLYEKIILIGNIGVPIIPYEVREEVSKISPIPDHHVRDPDPAEGARDQAVDILNQLKDILSRAMQAVTYKRHEATWNIHIHSPLLEMVFKWEVPDEVSGSGEITEPHARVEPMMSATIDGDSIPLRNSDPGTPDPVCSVAVDSAFLPSDSSQYSESSSWSMSQLRSRSAQVDYVVALDVPPGPLQTRISWALSYAGLYPHINQTSYKPVRETLIAISFEMKTEVYKTAHPPPPQAPELQLAPSPGWSR